MSSEMIFLHFMTMAADIAYELGKAGVPKEELMSVMRNKESQSIGKTLAEIIVTFPGMFDGFAKYDQTQKVRDI